MQGTRKIGGLGLLAVAALAVAALAPSASAGSLASGGFGIRAVNGENATISSVKGIGSTGEDEGSPSTPDRSTMMVVNTALPGCSADPFDLRIASQSSLEPSVSLSASGTIDWGDGAKSDLKVGANEHSYKDPGTYALTLDGSFGGFTKSSSNSCIQSVTHFGQDSGMVTLEDMFNGAQNIESVASIPSSVTNLHGMFLDAPNFNGDVSDWNTSNVEDMSLLFASASGSNSFSSDVSKWNTGKVRDFSLMFYNSSHFDSDLSRWDTSSANNLASMFNGASSFSSDVSSWKTSKVTNFGGLFANAQSFSSDLSKWNTSSATDMSFMFAGARSFNSDLGGWDTGRVSTMDYMFYGASGFDRDLTAWNVDSVATAVGFSSASGLTADHIPAKLRG